MPEESLLYSPEKTDQVSRVGSDRPKSEIVSSVVIHKLSYVYHWEVGNFRKFILNCPEV